MQGYSRIMIYNHDCKKILLSKGKQVHCKDIYDLPGEKINPGEDGFDVAYHVFQDETAVDRSYIELHHMMNLIYYNQDYYVEIYVGILQLEAVVDRSKHLLEWIDIAENFYDCRRYAGEGYIGHLVNQVKYYGIGNKQPDKKVNPYKGIDKNVTTIGVDGCKGGWIAAIIERGDLIIEKHSGIKDLIMSYSDFNEFIIDMVIGLPSRKEHIRPDTFARKIIHKRASTIFPAPCRQAVYAKSVSEAYDQNERVLGKKFTPLTVGIIPKMRELDAYLQENVKYKNVIKESHPEVCFARLNGETLLSKKSELEGMRERIDILTSYLPNLNLEEISSYAKKLKCNMDDIIDAICLAVTGNIVSQGSYEVIPEYPMCDETGLRMQMVLPKV